MATLVVDFVAAENRRQFGGNDAGMQTAAGQRPGSPGTDQSILEISHLN